MIFAVGTRVKGLMTRLGILTFRISLAILESEFLSRISRVRRQAKNTNSVEHQAKPVTSAASARSRANAQSDEPAKRRNTASTGFLPIVFIHKHNAEHLKYSFAQAKKSNPGSTVFVLGDDSNNQYDGVEHHQFRDYFGGAARFEEIYKHYSTHPIDFELICFQRWFILREFLTANKIDQCVYLDSDVLLYADVTEDLKKFARFDFTLCWNTIGCVFFLNRMEGLENFCHFMMDIYSKKDAYHYDKMVSHFAARRKNQLPGGACDMTALQLYNEINFGQVGEASHVIDGSVYDPNVNMPHPGFEMENGIKKILWKGDHPYGRFGRTGEEVRFNSLHFNGHAKRLMSRYCTADVPYRAAACE